VSGRVSIGTKEACEAASARMGLDSTAYFSSSSSYPHGCFIRYNSLNFNDFSASTRDCSYSSTKHCICLSGSICSITDGSAANTDECICGSTLCDSSTGLFCLSSYNTCSNSVISTCAASDGSASNLNACICGSTVCSDATGLICYSILGGGSCRKTTPGNYGFPTSKVGKCNDVAGRYIIASKKVCEEAATLIKGTTYNAYGYHSSSYPPGCFMQGTSLRYNSFDTSTRSCDYNSIYCICQSAPICSVVDGSAANSAPCRCGSIGFCTTSTGLFCTSSSSMCAVGPPCAFTNGLSANSGPCRCGVESCKF
jgi:hypothetical protein